MNSIGSKDSDDNLPTSSVVVELKEKIPTATAEDKARSFYKDSRQLRELQGHRNVLYV